MKTYCTSYSKRGSLVSRGSTDKEQTKVVKRSTASPDYISIDKDEEEEESRRRLKMKEKLAQYGRIDIKTIKGQALLQK